MRRRRAAERGQSMVEYALVLIPFLLLTMGVFDFGRAVFYKHLLTNAARDAARYGVAATRTAQQVCAVAASATAHALPGVPASPDCSAAGSGQVTLGSLTVDVSRGATTTSTPGYSVVTLRYVYQPITPLIGAAIGGSATLAAHSSMYVEPE